MLKARKTTFHRVCHYTWKAYLASYEAKEFHPRTFSVALFLDFFFANGPRSTLS